MAETAALLGEDTPVSPENYVPKETSGSGKLLVDYEDSENEKVVSPSTQQVIVPMLLFFLLLMH